MKNTVSLFLLSPIVFTGALSIAISAAFPENLFAADSLAVDQAIQEAHANSPEFLRMQAAADEASARPLEALAGHLPKLTFSGGYLTNHKFLLFPFGGTSFESPNPISYLTMDLGINLFDGFQTVHSWHAAKLSSNAAENEAQRAALILDDHVRLSFYQALSAQMLADVADQNVKTLQDHLAKTQALLSGGATTKLDTLRVDVQLSEALPDQIQAHDNVVITRKRLAQTMGLNDDNRLLTGTLPTPDAAKLPADLKLDTSQRNDLTAAQQRADAAGQMHLSSYAPWIPHVNLLAEYGVYNNIDNTLNTSTYQKDYSLGVYISWNLFDAANLAKMHEASAQQIQAEKTVEAGLQQAPVDFETWRRRFLYNVSLFKARSHAIESATESVRLARISYEAGSRTSTEVLDAELDLFRARAGVVRAQVDSAEALLNLELALGHRL